MTMLLITETKIVSILQLLNKKESKRKYFKGQTEIKLINEIMRANTLTKEKYQRS